jgi:hypothetical protein
MPERFFQTLNIYTYQMNMKGLRRTLSKHIFHGSADFLGVTTINKKILRWSLLSNDL